MSRDNEPKKEPTAEQIADNLKKGLLANRKGPKEFRKAFDEMFPETPQATR